MFYYLVAPNSVANRIRRWLGLSYRRTVLLRSEQRWLSMIRVIFEGANGTLAFGRVLAATDAVQGTTPGHIIGHDPSPSHHNYQSFHLRRLATEQRGQMSHA